MAPSADDTAGGFAVEPPSSHDTLASGFVQDQIRILSSLRVTAGTKVEHNDFSGAEIQLSGRVAWDLRSRGLLWGAVSRAVRVPTRIERDTAIDVANPAPNVVVRLLGNKDFDAEHLVAYEAGYRWQALKSTFLDVAAFHNRYHGLASLEFGDPFLDGDGRRRVIPILNENLTDGRAQGVEAFVTVTPTPTWRLSASSSTFSLSLDPHGEDLNRGVFLEGATPRHQFGYGLTSIFRRPFSSMLNFAT
jgi:iron complex outermembrane recepter protein